MNPPITPPMTVPATGTTDPTTAPAAAPATPPPVEMGSTYYIFTYTCYSMAKSCV